ncbi:MAG TPA: hypothetical protein VGO35_09170 [Gammaproteobacteria bacterium]|jgi:hypothetical protein|nr:hypothetical protein [Gammaproteobacteria bacterium]
MKLSAYLGLILLCLLPLGASADDTSGNSTPASSTGVTDQVSDYLKGQSILLGVSYTQGTFKMTGIKAPAGSAELTDNGNATAIIDYTSSEHVLSKMHMKYGDAVWGLNFVGTFGQQNTNYETIPGQSVIVGKNLGTKITGDYLAGAPFLYLRLSPLYPGSDSYWLFGYGIGGALWHFSGLPIIYTPIGPNTLLATAAPFDSSTKLYLYQTWRWQFHYGNWDVVGTVKYIGSGHSNGYNVSYQDYGIGIAYNIHF